MTFRSIVPVALMSAIALFGCKRARTIEEIEQVIEELEDEPEVLTERDPIAEGLERVRRLFVRGGVIEGEVIRRTLGRGEHRDILIELGEGTCYTIIGYGEPRTFDIDFELSDPNGQVVAYDSAPDNFPVIQHFCPSTSGLHSLRIIAAKQEGDAGILVFRIEDTAWNDASSRLEELAAEYLPGSAPVGAVQRTSLAEGREYQTPIALRPGHCYSVVVTAGDQVIDVDARLYDPAGETVRRDIGVDREPVIMPYCPELGAAYRLELDMYQGYGRVHWQLFEILASELETEGDDSES